MTAQDPSSTTPQIGPNPMFGPPLPPYFATSGNWLPHRKLQRRQKSFNVTMSPLLVVLPLLAAISLDIATQSSWASVSGFATIVFSAAGILEARRRADTLTPTAITSATLAVATGFNLILRSVLIVATPTWLVVLALLLSASADLSFRPVTQQIIAIANYITDVFRLPSWMVFSTRKIHSSVAPRTTWLPLVRGIALATLITVPVIALLASGDQIFASLLPSAGNIDAPIPHLFLMAMFFPMSAGLVLTATRPVNDTDRSSAEDRTKRLAAFPIELLVVFAGLVSY